MSDFFKGADEGIERGVSAPTLYSVDKADGGKIFVSTDKIRQHHFSDIVNNADGEVTVLSGSHGTADGTLIPEREFFDADIKAWGDTPNVNVLDVNLLSPEQLQKIVTGPGMTVCAWCYSERSVDILKAMGLI
nr:hypothetical protein [Listeria portnoyi]